MRRAASASSPDEVQFGMVVWGEMSQRIEIGLQISPAAEGVDHALLLLAVNGFIITVDKL